MGRYTLKVVVDGKHEFKVKIFEDGKLRDKVSLMAVDYFTIKNGPIGIMKNIDFDEAFLSGNLKFYVSYKSKGEEKKLDVIFRDNYALTEIAAYSDRQINIKNKVFLDFINNTFLPLLGSKKFVMILRKNNLISYKLEEWVENYLSGEYDLDFCYDKIVKYASEYRQFRNLIIGVELYHQIDITKPEVIDNKVYHEMFDSNVDDPDKSFGLFSEAELKRFSDYLDSLPSESEVERKTK